MASPVLTGDPTHSRLAGDGKEGVPFPVPDLPAEGNGRDTTFLYIRYNAADDGTRPVVPSTADWWDSPDVWVKNSGGINLPLAGVPNQVFAQVSNGGLQDASGVFVNFYWADPSLAITEATANRINASPVYVPLIPHQSSVIVPCPDPWTPVVVNLGHECLVAEAWIPLYDDLPYAHPAPLDPVTDRHVGQKNLHVVQAAAGQSFQFSLEVANISRLAQEIIVDFQALSFEEVSRDLSVPSLGFHGRLVPTTKQLPLEFRLAETGKIAATPSATHPLRLLAAVRHIQSGRREDRGPPAVAVETVTLRPGESRQLSVRGQVPPEAGVGQAFGFRISERMGDIVSGGYSVYVVVVRKTEK
jgi:hypothetical protein